MIYKFILLSEEADGFVREIQVDPDATFYELHQCIKDSVDYKNETGVSFYICDDDWETKEHVTFTGDEDLDPEFDNWIMQETPLNEFFEDEDQKMIYVFDAENERCFFLRLSEIIIGEEVAKAKCTRSEGIPPSEFLTAEIPVKKTQTSILDDDLFGEQTFDLDNFDFNGFEVDEKK